MHLWNAGIFLFSTETILGAFAEFAPETLSKVRNAFSAAETDLGLTRLAAEPWSTLEDINKLNTSNRLNNKYDINSNCYL